MKNVLVLSFISLFLITPATSATNEKVIGATVGDFADLSREGLRPLLEKKGYKIRVVEFTDYVQPNIALAEGSLDLNIFQHRPYLEQFSREKGLDLRPIAEVPTAPLGIYAGKLKTLAAIKDGSTIAMPNDPTNLARALLMLADLNWIILPKNIDPFKVSPLDIVKNPKNLKIVQLEAAQIPRSLQDVDYAIINGNYVVSSGMSLTSKLAPERSNAYINWAVVRTKDAQSAFAKAVIEALNSKDFQAYAKSKFKGYKYPSTWK